MTEKLTLRQTLNGELQFVPKLPEGTILEDPSLLPVPQQVIVVIAAQNGTIPIPLNPDLLVGATQEEFEVHMEFLQYLEETPETLPKEKIAEFLAMVKSLNFPSDELRRVYFQAVEDVAVKTFSTEFKNIHEPHSHLVDSVISRYLPKAA